MIYHPRNTHMQRSPLPKIISKVDSLKALIDLVPTYPSIPSIQTWRFYLHLRGDKNKKKLAVLNLSLLHFLLKHKRKTVPWNIPKSQRSQFDLKYQPGSFDTRLKTRFSIFNSNGIVYDLKEIKKRLFLSWLYDHWAQIAKVWPTFGSLPK